MVNIDDIKQFFRGHITISEPLNKYTSFRIGGPADYFLEPADKDDVVRIINYFHEQNIPFIIVGKGSNMLVSDEGIRGAVINLESGLTSMRVEGDRVYVDAGITIARFVDFCVQRGFKGVEMLAGIPGTIGGAIIMNAGAYGGEISDYLYDIEVLRNGKVIYLRKDEAGFSYRRSGFRGDIVLGASFKLPIGDKAEVMNIRRDLLIKRNRAQPVNFPNSGSMFKNPPGTYAAKLIEETGLKGTRRGNAQISEKHANFIVNLGGATAKDVLELIELARKTVLEKKGVTLELEVKLLGFSDSRTLL
ncbi:MAG: UDP-N-acetylmuramate dehydrogenase [Ignavibacteria bacterium]|nr:UDP-N-acetylmuramate dehydrogenase [Ignavibacteria bacterium]